MKKIAIVQPYLFPYLGYFQLAYQVDEFWLYDCVQYIRRGWMNRNYLYNKGCIRKFVFSVNKGSRSDLIIEKNFSDKFSNDLKKIKETYKELYAREQGYFQGLKQLSMLSRFSSLYKNNFPEVAEQSLIELFVSLKLKAKIRRTSTLEIPKYLKGQDRIIEICKRVSASEYINPAGGRRLYSHQEFLYNGIKLSFLNPNPLCYLSDELNELNKLDVNGLSILDFIARVSPDDYAYFLSNSILDNGFNLDE